VNALFRTEMLVLIHFRSRALQKQRGMGCGDGGAVVMEQRFCGSLSTYIKLNKV
jgi:hypothetical protein